jgi:hypothetical protein
MAEDELREEMVTVTIAPGGKIEVEVNGVKGEGCEALTASITALGESATLCRTAEYYETDETVKVSL